MARKKDFNWSLPEENTWDGTKVAVLMDIRDELKQLNRLLSCSNFTKIPQILRTIRRNTTKRKRRKP